MERREAAAKAAAEATMAGEKLQARQAYLDSGATAEEFEQAWPELRDRILKDRAAEEMQAASARERQRLQHIF